MHNVFICQMNDFDTNKQKTPSFYLWVFILWNITRCI